MKPPNDLILRLQGEGISTRYLQDRTGESRAECIKLLKSLGAHQDSMMWRLPSPERTRKASEALSRGTTEWGSGAGFKDVDSESPRRQRFGVKAARADE